MIQKFLKFIEIVEMRQKVLEYTENFLKSPTHCTQNFKWIGAELSLCEYFQNILNKKREKIWIFVTLRANNFRSTTIYLSQYSY